MRISKLDGLRGIFCVMVILVHYKTEYLPQWVYESFIVKQSGLFVDFFFVISGFVIALTYYNYINSIDTFWSYLKRRWIRLYPLLFFTTTLFLSYYLSIDLIKQFLPSLNQYFQSDSLNEHNRIIEYLDSILFLNSTMLLGNTMGMNYPSWSISAEMIVYVIFGLVMFVTKQYRVVLLSMVLIACITFCIYQNEFFFASDFGFVRALVSFIAGFFVWKLSKQNFNLHPAWELMVIPLVLSGLYCMHYTTGAFREILGMFMIPAFFGMAILLVLKCNGRVSRFLEWKPVDFLGKISYSIYLNHALLLVLIPKSLFRIFQIPLTTGWQILVLLITLLAIVGYSYVTYQIIEKRVGVFLKQKLGLR